MDTLTNQEFLYRENPVAYDGTGTITSIKGNTISFNQLVENGNFVDTSNWSKNATATYSTSNNELTLTFGDTDANRIYTPVIIPAGHKAYMCVTAKQSGNINTFGITVSTSNSQVASGQQTFTLSSTFTKYSKISTIANTSAYFVIGSSYSSSDASSLILKNAMVMDLTLMGIDNLTTTAEVENWLSTHLGNLPYYDYTTGKLISFNGTGLKTVGFNQWDEEWEVGGYDISTGEKTSASARIRSKNYIRVIPSETYYFARPATFIVYKYDANKSYIGYESVGSSNSLTLPSNCHYINFQCGSSGNPQTTYNNDICINISDASKNGTYEPYTSNTLSLPTLTYFPFGEDGVGTVYDELIPNSDVYKRIGIVDLGNVNYTYETSGVTTPDFLVSDNIFANIIKKPANNSIKANILCAKYKTETQATLTGTSTLDKIISFGTGGALRIKDLSYTDVSAFKSSMQGQYLIYELNTPLHNYGVVVLGDLTWGYNSNAKLFSTALSNAKPTGQVQTDKYVYRPLSGSGNDPDKCIFLYQNTLYVTDSSYTNVIAFKNSLANTYLLYELENPVAPSMDLTYPVWNGGTEQIIPVNGSTPTTAPILCDIDYRGLIPVNAEDRPDGSGTITGTGNYRYHSMATLTATPTDEIYRFLRWEDENGNTLSTDATYTFEVGE